MCLAVLYPLGSPCWALNSPKSCGVCTAVKGDSDTCASVGGLDATVPGGTQLRMGLGRGDLGAEPWARAHRQGKESKRELPQKDPERRGHWPQRSRHPLWPQVYLELCCLELDGLSMWSAFASIAAHQIPPIPRGAASSSLCSKTSPPTPSGLACCRGWGLPSGLAPFCPSPSCSQGAPL